MIATTRKFILGFFLLFWASSTIAQNSVKLSNDLKWIRNSVEFAALCEQTFRMAWPIVKARARAVDRNWVVVFDVDETVLDNSQYAVERTKIDSGFTPKSWTAWVQRQEAVLIPGVKTIIDSIRSLSARAHIAFITNRKLYLGEETPTIANLRQTGVYKDGDIILTKQNKQDTKASRRQCLKTGTGRCKEKGPLVILALFGDNIRDFKPMHGMLKAQNYRKIKLAVDKNWGTKYFILPNPNYGPWQRDYK